MTTPDNDSSVVSARDERRIRARFDDRSICTVAGWATYQPTLRQRWHRRHSHIGTDRPSTDYCPQAYTRCRKCGVWLRWFDTGTHRYGGIGR